MATTRVDEFKIAGEVPVQVFTQRLHTELNDIAEQCIKEDIATYEKRLRAKMGEVVLNLLSQYSVHRNGNDLVIHVKMEGNGR